jgi:hypothetical protein
MLLSIFFWLANDQRFVVYPLSVLGYVNPRSNFCFPIAGDCRINKTGLKFS